MIWINCFVTENAAEGGVLKFLAGRFTIRHVRLS